MKFELKTFNRNIPDEELLSDLRKVAKELGKEDIALSEYKVKGKYASDTLKLRFGGWNRAIEIAGLNVTEYQNIGIEALFENIEQVWLKLGRQPVIGDMRLPLSKYTKSPYQRNFGTWRKALEKFVEFINLEEAETEQLIEGKSKKVKPEQKKSLINNSTKIEEKGILKHATKRSISERMKVRVLIKYGNKCKLCGITVTRENIHFDHIKPWAKGGETVLENLQVLCAKHNLAKGDYWDDK